MGIRYFSENKEGLTVITQIVVDPTPEVIESILGVGTVYKEITTDVIDAIDSEFLGAVETDYTKLNDNTITLNLDKAKDITKDRLRVDRKLLLEAQDILFMQALESSADTTAIVTEKNRLRDITKDADDCTTTNELKALSVE
jgi:hypothetical protein